MSPLQLFNFYGISAFAFFFIYFITKPTIYLIVPWLGLISISAALSFQNHIKINY